MNLPSPTITVVIPLYNKAQSIKRTLLSVAQQKVQPDEICIIDDGSTDSSFEEAKAVINEHFDGIRSHLIQQPNQGVSAARNLGVELAKSHLVAFLDADDVWDVHFIERMKALYYQFPYAGAFTSSYQKVLGERFINPKVRMDEPLEPSILNNYFQIVSRGDLPFFTSTFCIKRSLAIELGGFPINEPMGEDQDLFAKAALNAKIAYDPMVLAYYHLDAENRACVQNCPKHECGFSQRLHRSCQLGIISGQLANHVLDYSAAHLLYLAKLNILAGDLETANHLLDDARCKRIPLKYWHLRAKARFQHVVAA